MQNGVGANVCKIMQARNGGSLQERAFRQFTLPYHIEKMCFCEMCISGSFVQLLQVALLSAVLKLRDLSSILAKDSAEKQVGVGAYNFRKFF